MNICKSCGKAHNVGFVSTRFAGTDGVSLETEKWAEVFELQGFNCFYLAGELDRPSERSYMAKEAHFMHPEVRGIYRKCFGTDRRERAVTKRIHEIVRELKDHLYSFVEKIAHHHDFFWERQQFLTNAVWEYLNMAFPPHLPSIKHVVINSSADNQLSLRTGISSTIIPNVMDFANPPPPVDEYASDVRESLGIDDDTLFILQPTRVVERKGIEHAIELVQRLGMKSRLVISHASGDEGYAYEQRIKEYSKLLGVDTVFVSEIINERRGTTKDGRKIYSLEDTYPHADLITYPATIEGFGNAFLEAMYFRKPIVLNTYSIYEWDIRPKGFSAIEIDGYVTEQAVRAAKDILTNPELRQEIVDKNYEIATQCFSYAVLEKKLRNLLTDFTECDLVS
jgi:glycosyltransferase involved in cell wall biosynthesis